MLCNFKVQILVAQEVISPEEAALVFSGPQFL